MPYHGLSTSRVAKLAGCHPNTVRLYEAQGYIATAPRSPAGYRLFTPYDVDQMILAKLALQWPYPGGKTPVDKLVRLAAVKELTAALEQAKIYLDRIQQELDYARKAVMVLEQWAQGQPPKPKAVPLRISETARLLGITTDALRNWERNGLVTIPRNNENHYRIYNEPELSRLSVIRVLRQAGYSMMSMLRTIRHLDLGFKSDLGAILGEPQEDEDVVTVADRWLATLKEQKKRGKAIISHIEEMIRKYSPDYIQTLH